MTQWRNWAGDQRCAPVAIERPRSEAELAEVVRAGAARGLAVRAIGSGHSFTDCACTDGVMIDMSALKELVHVDGASGLVTVQGGIKLHALGPLLATHGLALENQGDIDRQSITGAISTGTHGTGGAFANLSSQITGMRLVGADGEVRQLSREHDPEALLAARVSLGALGVIAEVTLQAVELYTLHRQDAPAPLAQTLERLQESVETNDHFEFFVFPYTRTALTRSTRRSFEAPAPTPHWKRYVQEDLLENRLLGMLCRVGRRVPRLAPKLNGVFAAAMSPGYVQDRGHRVYATKRAVRFNEMEYAVAREHAGEVVQRVLALIERRRLPILFPLEVRFSAADDAFLSPSYAQNSCYIAVHQFIGMEFESFFRGVEAIMDEYGARPHWGKRHYQSAASLQTRYPQWERFQAVRERLDPTRVFSNEYTQRVLG